jgi:hypothetical protein
MELAKYGFDLVEAQKVRWEEGGTEPLVDYVRLSVESE